jgi:putative transcription factor
LTKVDRNDDVVPTQKNDTKVLDAIKKRRAEEGFKMTQAQLAQKCNVSANDIKNLESGTAAKNQQLLNKVCRVLKISSRTGEPLAEKEKK